MRRPGKVKGWLLVDAVDEVLGFGGPFPYLNTSNYVFSRQERQPDSNPVQFINENPAAFALGGLLY